MRSKRKRNWSTYIYVQHLWDTFKTQLKSTTNTNIPHKEIKSRNSIPWIRKKERKMLKKKQQLYRQARKTKKWSNYRSYQKEGKRHLQKAEYEYINQNNFEGLKNNNTKPFFWEIYKIKTTRCRRNCTSEKGSKLDQRQQRESRTPIRPIQVSLY